MVDAGFHFVECFWHCVYTQDFETLNAVISPDVSATIEKKGEEEKQTFQGREAFLDSVRAISENAIAIIGNGKVYRQNVYDSNNGYRIVEVHFSHRFKVKNMAAPELYAEGDQRFTFVYTDDRWMLTNYHMTNFFEDLMDEGAVLVSNVETPQGPAPGYRYCVIS